MDAILITSEEQLDKALNRVLDKREAARERKGQIKSVTIHKAARQLGRADATVKKLVMAGILKTTIDGRIPELELERFLNNAK